MIRDLADERVGDEGYSSNNSEADAREGMLERKAHVPSNSHNGSFSGAYAAGCNGGSAAGGNGHGAECSEVEMYIRNCRKYQVPVDPSVIISLKTRWHIMQPTKSFCEGAMLPLAGILDGNDHIRSLVLRGAGMHNRKPAAGNGNSNARILRTILSGNTTVEAIDLSNTGLDNEGIAEVSRILAESKSLTSLNLSCNHFGATGARALEAALGENKSLTYLDVSRNALGFRSINALQQRCAHRKHSGCCAIRVETDGNYVFEEVLNSLSHSLGFILSIIGTIVLMSEASRPERSPVQFWSCAVFSASLMVLYLSSTLYHSFFMIPHISSILQIADHVAIYLLIAGSYTPFLMIGLHGSSVGAVVVVVEWIAALVGSAFSISCDLKLSSTMVVELTLYLGMGLAVLCLWGEVSEAFEPGALYLLCGGGAAYVFGVIFFIIGEMIPVYHVFWHLFVMIASAMHWFAIYWFLAGARLGPQCEALQTTGGDGGVFSW